MQTGFVSEESILQAYNVDAVVQNFPRKIESICYWIDQILVGLEDGNLLYFKCIQDGSAGKFAWQVVGTHRDLERKAMLQMLAVDSMPRTAEFSEPNVCSSSHPWKVDASSSRHLLLSITVDGLNVRSLPGARLRCQAVGTKGASCFAWHEEGQVVVVAVKRRLLFFKLVTPEGRKGGATSKAAVDLEEAAELSVPDYVNTMVFAGRNLFVGCRKNYYLIPEALSAIPADNQVQANVVASLVSGLGTPPDSPGNSGQNRVPLGQTTEICGVGAALRPAVAVCPAADEVLMASDNMAVFVSRGGALSRRSPLSFKEPLLGLAASEHYAVGFMRGGAQVLSLRRSSDAQVTQLIPDLEGSRLIAQPGFSQLDGSLVVGLSEDKGIRRLIPVPLVTQAEILAAAGEYQEALALAAIAAARGEQPGVDRSSQEGNAQAAEVAGQESQETENGVRQLGEGICGLEDRLRLLYGNHLFASGEWDDGAAQLALCSGRVTGLTGSPLLLLRLLPSLVPETLRVALPERAAGMNLLKVNEPTGPAYAAAASVMLPYLMSYRTRITATFDAHQQRAGTSKGQGGEVQEPHVADGVAAECQRVLLIIDLALVKILLVQSEDCGGLLRFVQQPRHWIALSEGEKLLGSYGWYAELVALYKHHGRHQEGLQLLHKLSEDPKLLEPAARGAAADLKGLPGVWAAVRYLVSLGGHSECVPLIREHAKWILEADPDAGLQAFLEMQPPLDPSTVLGILHQHSPHYCSMYLETALQLGVALPQDYHSELLLIYLQEILGKDEVAMRSLRGNGDHGGIQSETESIAGTGDSSRAVGDDGSDSDSSSGLDDAMEGMSTDGSARRSIASFSTSSAQHHELFPVQKSTGRVHVPGVGSGSRLGREGGDVGSLAETGDAGGDDGAPEPPSSKSAASGGSAARCGEDAAAGVVGAATHPRDPGSSQPGWTAASNDPSEAEDIGGSKVAVSRGAYEAQGKLSLGERGLVGSVPGDSSSGLSSDEPGVEDGRRKRRGAHVRKRRKDRSGWECGGRETQRPPYASSSRLRGPSLYERLRHLVYTSPYIDPDYVLTKLPPGQLPEIRALMLERLRRHKDALILYVQDLRDMKAAEAYCDRVYAAELSLCQGVAPGLGAVPLGEGGQQGAILSPLAVLRKPADIYLILTQIVLDAYPPNLPEDAASSPGDKEQRERVGAVQDKVHRHVSVGERIWSQTTWMLSRKCGRVDPLEVLDMLPDATSIASVVPWLSAALALCTEQSRNTAVVKHLRRSETLYLKEAVGRARQGNVVISGERTCCLCYKRIGMAVFVSYPDRTLAHYVCHTRNERQQKKGVKL